jgi:hypothetical protein
VEAGDVNGDGYDDLLSLRANTGAQLIDIWFASGPRSFCPRRTVTINTLDGSSRDIGVADMDADGRLDLLATTASASQTNGRVNVLLNSPDRTNPTVPVPSGTLYSLQGQWTNTATQSLTYSASDSGAGIVLLELYVDDVLKQTKTQTCTGGCSASNTFSFVTNQYADGHHQIRIRGVDIAGNAGTRTFDVHTDLTAPIVTSFDHTDRPAGWTDSTADPSVTVQGDDPASGVRRLQLHVPAAAVQTQSIACSELITQQCPNSPSRSFTYDLGALAEGVHTIRATASNAFLTESEPDDTWNVKIDRTPPAATVLGGTLIASQAGGGVAAGDYTVTAEMSDVRSGVKSWQVKLDGDVIAGGDGEHSCSAVVQCPTSPAAKAFTVDTRPLAVGEHTLDGEVVDAVGKQRTDTRAFIRYEQVSRRCRSPAAQRWRRTPVERCASPPATRSTERPEAASSASRSRSTRRSSRRSLVCARAGSFGTRTTRPRRWSTTLTRRRTPKVSTRSR